MAEVAELAIKVDVAQVEAAASALTALALAAERANAALAALGNDRPLNVRVTSVGDVSKMDIRAVRQRRA